MYPKPIIESGTAILSREHMTAPVQVCPELPQHIEIAGYLAGDHLGLGFEAGRQAIGGQRRVACIDGRALVQLRKGSGIRVA